MAKSKFTDEQKQEVLKAAEPNCWNWKLSRQRQLFIPRPIKGQLGIFEVDKSIMEGVGVK